MTFHGRESTGNEERAVREVAVRREIRGNGEGAGGETERVTSPRKFPYQRGGIFVKRAVWHAKMAVFGRKLIYFHRFTAQN